MEIRSEVLVRRLSDKESKQGSKETNTQVQQTIAGAAAGLMRPSGGKSHEHALRQPNPKEPVSAREREARFKDKCCE